MRILITGGAGFIGSALIRRLLSRSDLGPELPADVEIVNLDKLTYAGSLPRLASVSADPRYKFILGDICDAFLLSRVFADHAPDAVIHLAAETHVDRSIDASADTLATNVMGTYALLEAARASWERLPVRRRARFRFIHVSTDEVFGSLTPDSATKFCETSPIAPSSPYSASKAASDSLVNAWNVTYGLPTVVTNCSNNYGPWQFPEKLIPRMVVKAVHGEKLPIHGTGANIRDWLHVDDHCDALVALLRNGIPGRRYCIGGDCERTNADVVNALCVALGKLLPRSGSWWEHGVEFVADRPGNDARYAIDFTRLQTELGWRPTHRLEDDMLATVAWYLENRAWWERLENALYDTHRLGRVALQKKTQLAAQA